ncbi:hypothetical protein ACP4OV_021953 [Aristida adscensionis]
MKSSKLLMALVVIGILAAMAKENAADNDEYPPRGKFRCCDDCEELYSGLITCHDVHYRCHPACNNCTVVATQPIKKYTCSDRYFGACAYPCHKKN